MECRHGVCSWTKPAKAASHVTSQGPKTQISNAGAGNKQTAVHDKGISRVTCSHVCANQLPWQSTLCGCARKAAAVFTQMLVVVVLLL